MSSDDASGPTWSIGDVAREAGLSVKVVRHWSDVGVVTPVGRSAGGYRRYDAAGLARLRLARTLRDLGMGLGEIRDALDREDGLTEVAAAHVEALETQIRRLRAHQAVLRTVTRRTTHEGLALMTRTAHMYPDERRRLVHDFLTGTLGDLDVPHFREGLLAAGACLPDDPTDEQVEAWLELGELVAGGELGPAMRRLAEYAARQGKGVRDAAVAEEMRALTDTWTARVREAVRTGTAADSPAADQVVADVIAAWLPSRANSAPGVSTDDAEARALLREQLTAAAEPAVERFWHLLCVLGGRPAPAGIAEEGRWLVTALRTNPAPGARDAQLEALYADGTDPWPGGVLDAFTRVQDRVAELVRATTPGQFGLPTPCSAWTVRDLLDHLVWENIIWGGLAQGSAPDGGPDEDHLGDDHIAAFETAAAEARAAFLQPGLLDRSFGPAPGRRLVEQLLIELLVHAWDLATALGHDPGLEPKIAHAALPVVHDIYGPLPRTPGGSLAPPRPAPAHAPALDQVAAFLGRRVGGGERVGGPHTVRARMGPVHAGFEGAGPIRRQAEGPPRSRPNPWAT
ncbi:TIGR03086 family metal-binding protein [Streptomyces sp. HNM0574]|uniref:TIGR03086 family metal-binding protein n=1 Tax=Streptomyces sp. HNM0574 TaxID=2714954 RepID=UPI001469EF54|nr:TIGR03086 family metal-binding protein [Streptomyces sp. HNM0574]NLU70466.1 TIGR03086 family protein [Streptomyces sp. HNM0574]